jgi:hypothetical protein
LEATRDNQAPQVRPSVGLTWELFGVIRRTAVGESASRNGTICSPGGEPWVPRPLNIPEPVSGRQSCIVP